jgi:hypothetical protein
MKDMYVEMKLLGSLGGDILDSAERFNCRYFSHRTKH